MSTQGVPSAAWNPWKWAAIGMALLLVIGVIGGAVMARHVQSASPEPDSASLAAVPPDAAAQPPAAQPVAPPPPVVPRVPPVPPDAAAPAPPAARAVRAGDAPVTRQATRPSSADIKACRRFASSGTDPAAETLTDALVGGVAGAGVGAAGGAIADGGRGAGKGAGIGGLVGATAGTLFGLSRANQRDAGVAAAYRQCMRQRGYVD